VLHRDIIPGSSKNFKLLIYYELTVMWFIFVKYELLTAVIMKTALFSDVMFAVKYNFTEIGMQLISPTSMQEAWRYKQQHPKSVHIVPDNVTPQKTGAYNSDNILFFQLSKFVHMLFDIRSEFPRTHSLPRHDKAKYIN